MTLVNLPAAIAEFFNALRRRDLRAILAAFAKDAVLVDGEVEHCGQAIGDWIEQCVLQGNATVQPINAARREGAMVVTVMAWPWHNGQGGRVAAQLDWRFTILNGQITALRISTSNLPDLPSPIAAYVFATNTFDLDAMLQAFTDDAVVNDQLREYWGKKAIRSWADNEIIADRVTMYVVRNVQHYGNSIVTAYVDGDYDKRGLPDPLVLTFYFSIHAEKIIQLIILRNEPDV